MFNNLIESSSHRTEFKRRGSFFLFTVAGYALLFAVAGVASIYAYDAQLEKQSDQLELISFVPPELIKTPDVRPVNTPHAGGSPSGNQHVTQPTVTERIDRTDNPRNVPNNVTTSPALPTPSNASQGSRTELPFGNGDGSNKGNGSGTGDGNNVVPDIGTPPPAQPKPEPKPVPAVVRRDVINSAAIELPKPPYPPMAKSAGIQGSVNVQVLVDETGKVVSAKAVSGSPFLSNEAVRAAYKARFSPARIGDQPVKVSGVIVYNFILN